MSLKTQDEDQEIKAFTLRLPKDLVEKIDLRAKHNRRSRVAEVQFLLGHLVTVPEATLLSLLQG